LLKATEVFTGKLKTKLNKMPLLTSTPCINMKRVISTCWLLNAGFIQGGLLVEPMGPSSDSAERRRPVTPTLSEVCGGNWCIRIKINKQQLLTSSFGAIDSWVAVWLVHYGSYWKSLGESLLRWCGISHSDLF
jgi:hypothetical protein